MILVSLPPSCRYQVGNEPIIRSAAAEGRFRYAAVCGMISALHDPIAPMVASPGTGGASAATRVTSERSICAPSNEQD